MNRSIANNKETLPLEIWTYIIDTIYFSIHEFHNPRREGTEAIPHTNYIHSYFFEASKDVTDNVNNNESKIDDSYHSDDDNNMSIVKKS